MLLLQIYVAGKIKILTDTQQCFCGRFMSPVTIKILSDAKKCFYGRFMSPATIKDTD